MSNPIPRIRWLLNAEFNVRQTDGSIKPCLFKSGSYTYIDKIVDYGDGYADIHLPDDVVVVGIKWREAIELHGENVVEHGVYTETKPVEELVNFKDVENESTRKWKKWEKR